MTREVVQNVQLRDESDVGVARRHARLLARETGLPETRAEALATAVSELARNCLLYAKDGEVLLGVGRTEGRICVFAVARDSGPGIADLAQALQDGHSTGSGLGLGLPSAKRLVDAFDIRSDVGVGTTITLEQWIPAATRA
jgi:serine/threonine-protein kinase RsbT